MSKFLSVRQILALTLIGCLFSPVSASGAPLGVLHIDVHQTASELSHHACPAVLITPDAAITSASCFDFLSSAGVKSGHDYTARFELDGGDPSGGHISADILSHTLAPGYVPIDCDGDDAEGCEQADAFCQERFDGLARNVCRFNKTFYARSLRKTPSHDVALLLLNRLFESPHAALAVLDDETLFSPSALRVTNMVEEAVAPTAIAHDEASLRLAETSLRGDVVALVTPTGELVAWSSHLATLSPNPSKSQDYIFGRLDHERPWIDARLYEATQRHQRLSATMPRWIRATSTRSEIEDVEAPQPTHAHTVLEAQVPSAAQPTRRFGCERTVDPAWAVVLMPIRMMRRRKHQAQ